MWKRGQDLCGCSERGGDGLVSQLSTCRCAPGRDCSHSKQMRLLLRTASLLTASNNLPPIHTRAKEVVLFHGLPLLLHVGGQRWPRHNHHACERTIGGGALSLARQGRRRYRTWRSSAAQQCPRLRQRGCPHRAQLPAQSMHSTATSNGPSTFTQPPTFIGGVVPRRQPLLL